MADFKLVGAVAIKVRPDTSKFRKETQAGVSKALAGFEADVKVTANVELDSTKAKAEAKATEKELSGKTVTWNVKLDHDSVREAQKRFDSLLEPTKKISFKLDDKGSIEKAREALAKMAREAQVKITYVQDEKGYQSILDKIAALRREKLEKTIHIGTDDAELDALEKKVRSKIAALSHEDLKIPARSTLKIEYDENRAGLLAAVAEIDRELAKFKDQTFYINADKPALLEARAAVQEALDQIPAKVHLTYDENRAGLETAIATIDAEIAKIGAAHIDVDLDRTSLLAQRAILAAELKDTPMYVNFTPDDKGYQNVLEKIRNIQRQRAEIPIDLNLTDAQLEAKAKEIEARLAAATKPTIRLEYDNNRPALELALKQVEAELAKIRAINVDIEIDEDRLMAAKAFLDRQLSEHKIRFEYDENLASMQAAKAKIEALLHIPHLAIESDPDEASLREALAKINAMIDAERNKNSVRVKVKPEISKADYAKTLAAVKTLAKNQTVGIAVKLNNASVLLAAAKLTGLRAAFRWTEGFAKSLGTLDRNLPIVATAVVGLSTLASGMLSLTASAFSLGNGLGEVVRMTGVLAPAMILGLGSTMLVLKAVFKDFGAAIHGINAAMKRLPPSGQEAARTFRAVFAAARESISEKFWDRASDGMLRFSKTALPAVSAGLVKLSGSLGGVFSHILDSFTRFTEQGGIKVFFENMARGFEVAQTGMASFMSGFLTLAVVGSTAFPRIGKAFEAWAGRFDGWVQRLAADGTLSRWTDRGVQGLKDLFNAGGSLVKVWGNIGQAAQASGALTLHSFAQMMSRLDEVTAGGRFQKNMATIFKGAREASISFHKALGDLGPAMDVFSVTIRNALSGSGAALGAFIATLGDIMSSPRLNVGITAFLGGIKDMFEQLRPAAAPVAEILQTFGQILGSVARDSGPLFRNLFQQLATVLTTAWHSLEPLLPGLMQVGTTIVNTLGPALASVASVAIPAFATAVQKIGDGLIPIIKFVADLTAGFIGWASSLPLPLVAGMAGAVLALGGSFAVANAVLPILSAGLEFFGVTAALTGIRLQLMIPVVGILLAAISGLALAGVATLATSQRNATPFANEYEAALRKDAEAAGALAGAIGEATTATAIKKLVDSGALDAAKKLGIGVQEVTDAVLKGGPALEVLKGKLSGLSSSTDENARAAEKAARKQGQWSKGIEGEAPVFAERKRLIDLLTGAVDDNNGSLEEGRHKNELTAEANKAAAIGVIKHADAQKSLADELGKSSKMHGAAAAASQVLNDAFSSTTAKVDAMRKTFEIFVGKSAKQDVAETLGAYAKGFNDLKETVGPVAESMRKLGDAAYGENGFLNVGSGNKAVLQVNQALVDEVNNVWAGAKATYDAALKQGDNVFVAFKKAQDFIDTHKGDYDALATASGVSADKVKGQWDAVFGPGHEWVLQVSLQGATEAAEHAQAMILAIKGNFDGKKFMAFLDANPDEAIKATYDAKGVAQDFVNHEWQATLKALPTPAQDALRALTGMTEADWNKGDFEATLRAAKDVPGLAEALTAIRNGASASYVATLFAQLNGASVSWVEYQLNLVANKERWVKFNVTYADEGVDAARARRGTGQANGAILDRFGRGMNGFAGQPVKMFANGGIERQIAQITKPGGPIRIWSEPSTNGEAFIPYAKSKRPRSVAILSQVARDFGYSLTQAQNFANGAAGPSAAPTRTSSTSVTVGTINTVDPESAVRKLRTLQQDALAVAGLI